MNIIYKLSILNIYLKIISNELTIAIRKQILKQIFNIYIYLTNYITYCIITFIFVKIIIGQVIFFSW